MASWIVFLVVAFGTSVIAQNNQQQPFVTVPTHPASIDVNAEKVYRTRLTIITLNLTASNTLNTTVTDLYNTTGFISLNVVNNASTSPSNNTLSTMYTYDVRYNYTSLNSSAKGSDDAIAETIGNVTYLKDTLESDPVFSSLYNVSTSGFTFTGNSMCGKATGCETYTSCHEITEGVTVTCRSVCYDDFCLNGGYCHHDDINTPPVCSCASFFDSWYVGDHCQTLFQVWMMALFFVIVFLILVALIPVIACLCIKQIPKRIRKEKEKAKKAIEKEQRKNETGNGTINVKDKTILTALPLGAEVGDNISKSIPTTTPTATPIPAPRNHLSSPARTPERHESISSAGSTTTSATSYSSNNQTDTHTGTHRTNEGETTEALSAVDEPNNRGLYQEIAGTMTTCNESHSTSSNSNSDTTDSDDSSDISIHEIPNSQLPIKYKEPPMYATIDKQKPLYLEEPLVSTV